MHPNLIKTLAGTVVPCAVAVAQPAIKPGDTLSHPPVERPLSSMVAVYVLPESEMDIGELVKMRVNQYATDTLPKGAGFPLAAVTDDNFRTIPDLSYNLVAKWLDPLTTSNAPTAPVFGANCDYIAYFGTGWDDDWRGSVVGSAPQFNGSGSAGWIWSNFEYVSNGEPEAGLAPTGQHLTHALYLVEAGILDIDVTDDAAWTQEDADIYTREYKRQIGGGWFRVFQNAETGEWRVFRDPNAERYDGTDATLLRLVGHDLNEPDNDDKGNPLPDGIVVGITGDCSGGQTPWGTIVTAEENVQTYYGDLETSWTSNQRFVLGAGFDPGAPIDPTYAPAEGADWTVIANPDEWHNRDVYGYLVEIDPQADASTFYESISNGGDGVGHRKVGGLGRARWENCTFVTDSDWELIDGEPIVLYAGNDRRSGRIWKYVTSNVYEEGMTRAEVRALMDEGSMYVAHFEDLDAATGFSLFSTGEVPSEDKPGTGRWIKVSTTSDDTPPNADALGTPDITVGEALQDLNYNNIGGFPTDNDVRNALFTAAMKIGVSEMNRPEDIEWNPLDISGTPRIYVAFTNHTRQVGLTQDGVLYDPADHPNDSPQRTDAQGHIFAMQENDPDSPAGSDGFTYWRAWGGTNGDSAFDAVNPDNLAIDNEGGVWFGTDGNFGNNGHADAYYYLDLDPAHKAGEPGIVNPTFGLPFRIAATPSDAEATGPAFSADMRTLFGNVQHPGENVESTWPQDK